MTNEHETTEVDENVENLWEENDADLDAGSSEESWDQDIDSIKAENERLRKKVSKLNKKKQDAIAKRRNDYISLEEVRKEAREEYSRIRNQEKFERDYPELDYEIVSTIAEKKWVSVEEAVYLMWSQTSSMLGREYIPKIDSNKVFSDQKKAEMAKKMWLA